MKTWATHVYETPSPHPVLYIVTDSMFKTSDGLTWGTDVSHTTDDVAPKKDISHWMSLAELVLWYEAQEMPKKEEDYFFRTYTHPIIAILLERVHDDIKHPVLWECSGDVKYITVDKIAHCTQLKTMRVIRPPQISLYTRMKFGFGCVDKVYQNQVFLDWILDWIGGTDRTQTKAEEIAEYCSKQSQENVVVARQKFAASWMCMAACAYADLEKAENLVEYWTGMAAVESAQIAHALKIPNFDLVSIAELTMAAR